MNHSQSPGFLYYDTSATASNTSNTSGNTDFIEFNTSKSPQKHFSPGHYSSPTHNLNYRRGRGNTSNFPGISGRGRYGRNNSNANNRQSFNNSRKSFNNSPYQNSRGSANSSYNSQNYKSFNKSYKGNDDLINYINPSMVQDPWAELERSLNSSLQSNLVTDQSSVGETESEQNCEDIL